MPNRMLIDASHPEETRVVVIRDNRIAEYDFESEHKKQIKGNIYLARVTRIEPSLQAAFVEYGGNKQGFLAFSEIHPDYYQLPQASKQDLAKSKPAKTDQSETSLPNNTDEKPKKNSRRRKTKEENTGINSKNAISDKFDNDSINLDSASNSEIELVGAEDVFEETIEMAPRENSQYKIQEVIKKRQILLVQVLKEERGNKGAGLTTYLSLAGRYSVLMPNTNRGGGISRKITTLQDRKRLKEIVKDLNVPEGMGVILRTAGAKRTKVEIKRDYDYLIRLWNKIRECTLNSIAPALVHEEGSLIKRAIRDLYDKTIDEILVAGDAGYKEAKSFIRTLMPSHTKVVQPYNNETPIFAQNNIETELDKMLQPQVSLKSGGYLVMNQTEALVAIDVNSGRSTKENSIEETAYQTNLEAAEEIALQLRLRDLAGLIVIDFIDMSDKKNIRNVEKCLKDSLKADRARIQVGYISPFGLLEMSRQRIRTSFLESTTHICPECDGTGYIRSQSSIALQVLRSIEDYLMQNSEHNILVKTSVNTALYMLNNKRQTLTDLEKRFQLTITILAETVLEAQHFLIEKHGLSEHSLLQNAAKALEMPKEPPKENKSNKQNQNSKHTTDTKQEKDVNLISLEPTEKTSNNEIPQTTLEQTSNISNKKRRRGRRGGKRNRQQIPSSEQINTTENVSEASDKFSQKETINNKNTENFDLTIEEPNNSKNKQPKRTDQKNNKKTIEESSKEKTPLFQDQADFSPETVAQLQTNDKAEIKKKRGKPTKTTKQAESNQEVKTSKNKPLDDSKILTKAEKTVKLKTEKTVTKTRKKTKTDNTASKTESTNEIPALTEPTETKPKRAKRKKKIEETV